MPKIKGKRILFLLIVIIGAVLYWNFRITPDEALSNFKKATVEAPLFASTELNIVETEKSLAYFRNVQQQLKDDYFLDEEITKTKFLEEVIEVKKATESFEKNPSKETAELLIVSYKNANNVYRSEIESLKNKIQEYFPFNTKQPLIYPGSTSDNQIILKDLELMLQNAVAQEKEIQKREYILNGKIGHKTPKIQVKLPEEPKTRRIDISAIESKQVDLTTNEGTFWIKTACFQDMGSELPFAFYLRKDNDGLTSFIPKLVETSYYQKLNEGDKSESVFTSQGLEWHRIREGNSYRCNDLTYYADLLALRNFVKDYKGNFLFTGTAPKGDESKWQEGGALEQRLLANNVTEFYTSDLTALGNYYQYFGQKNSNQGMTSRYLLIANKQNTLPAILNSNFSFENLIKRFDITNSNNAEITKKYFFLNRNNYSYIFLNFSSSVWLLSEKPVYTEKISENSGFANLQTLKNKYSSDKIEAFDAINENILLAGY